MASRTATKPGRPAAKGTVKTPGKDQVKGEKPTTNVLEIVPGKFNENDWLLLLENDETEDFIADIFDDIWKETSQQIQQIYIRRQLLPFTLMMTEHALSSIIQVKKNKIFSINLFSFFYSGHFWKEMNLNQQMVTFGQKIRVRKKNIKD
jgi:hypothetical protein